MSNYIYHSNPPETPRIPDMSREDKKKGIIPPQYTHLLYLSVPCCSGADLGRCAFSQRILLFY